MRILLTGANGYIGKRLLPVLIEKGHHVICCVRDAKRFNPPKTLLSNLTVVQVDFLKPETLTNIPHDLDVAYYLVHSMSGNSDYKNLEEQSAKTFCKALNGKLKQVIYLSGIVNDEHLSEHLNSRLTVEKTLDSGNWHTTTLRAGIIIGSGSASFEIIRDLVEKLPIMMAPKWLNTRCQPIAIANVLDVLSQSCLNPKTFDRNFDIGGMDVLTYKQMLIQFAKIRKLRRWIFTFPIMTPKLSSYWLYFMTSTSYNLASALVKSMRVEVVCRDNEIFEILNIKPYPYSLALIKAFTKIESNAIVSSWKDSFISSNSKFEISQFIKVPEFGCFIDKRTAALTDESFARAQIWRIGGKTGWYYGNWLWRLRGFLDKISGGVGLRRGRTSTTELNVGDTLDFWRVLYANKKEGRLLLFAEMKLPGEAWLEFEINDGILTQTATFRPKGVLGRLYWFSVLPFHGFIFRGLLKAIILK